MRVNRNNSKIMMIINMIDAATLNVNWIGLWIVCIGYSMGLRGNMGFIE